MTIVVYDGKSIAIDRAAVSGTVIHRATKAWVHGDAVITGTGAASHVSALVNWYKQGADADDYPVYATHAELIVATSVNLLRYERSPHPVDHGNNKCAFGDGRDLAYGALAMGATAAQAAQVACHYNPNCGGGLDIYDWEDGRVVAR